MSASPAANSSVTMHDVSASAQMLMAFLGRKHNEPKATAAASFMQTAIDTVVTQAKHLTKDLGGKASTQEMGDAIAAAVLQ